MKILENNQPIIKLEDYLASLPRGIISGEDVQLPDHSFREIFKFVNLGENDILYHLGCGNGKGIAIALEEFGVKKAVGIDIDRKKIEEAKILLREKNVANSQILNEDILDSHFNDATVILFWFTDTKIIEMMMEKFEKLRKWMQNHNNMGSTSWLSSRESRFSIHH